MVKRLELASIVFFFFGAVVGLFVVGYTRQNQIQLMTNAATPLSFTLDIPTPTALPTATPIFIPSTTTASQISPDGTKNVTVTTTQNKDKTQTVTVSTDNGESTIFTTTLQADQAMIVPFNTWSPNDRYFFLQKKTQTAQQIMVFKENGDVFTDGSPYLDLTTAYNEHSNGDAYEATGWAGYNVIVINTTLTDGSQGRSYWYEVPSGAIINLSTKF